MLSHLKVFRSISNVHISDHDSNKLDTKSLKCTFIGYNINDFVYKFWDDHNKKVIRSRNVIFNRKVLQKDRDTTQSTNLVKPEPLFFEPNDVHKVVWQIRQVRIIKFRKMLHKILIYHKIQIQSYNEEIQQATCTKQ